MTRLQFAATSDVDWSQELSFINGPTGCCAVPALMDAGKFKCCCNNDRKENRINGRGDQLRRPRDTLYPQKLALTSPTSGGLSFGMVRLRTKGHGV
jgi:hypothetical protein